MNCWVLCAHAWVAVVCTVWRQEVSIRCLLCSLFMLFFLRKGLSLNLRLSDSAKLANTGSLPIPTSQSWDHCSQPVWLPMWVLYSLSLLSSPSSQIFGCPGMLVQWIFIKYFWMDWSVVCAYCSELWLFWVSRCRFIGTLSAVNKGGIIVWELCCHSNIQTYARGLRWAPCPLHSGPLPGSYVCCLQ